MKILDRLPFSQGPSEVSTPDGIAEVKPYQIVVIVSLVARDLLDLPQGSPRFPAILDTGTNHNLSVRTEHFERWARLRLRQRGKVRIQGDDVPLVAGSVWIHPNRPGTHRLTEGQAIRLEMRDGLIVYPETAPNPARLPILGLRALVRNHLKLIIDGRHREVTLKTPSWFRLRWASMRPPRRRGRRCSSLQSKKS